MASLLVSFSLPLPVSASDFSIKELQQRKAALTSLSSSAMTKTATNLLVPRTNLAVNQWRCCKYLTTPADHFHEPFWSLHVMKLNAKIPWSEPMEAPFSEIILPRISLPDTALTELVQSFEVINSSFQENS